MTRERRRRPRVGWDGDALACVGMHRIRCRGRDLSATGLSVEGEWVAYPGQHVSVQMSLEGQRIDAYGEVAWAAAVDGKYFWGVRFVALHERCRRSLERFVDERLHDLGARTQVAAGVPKPASLSPTDAVVLDRTVHEEEVTLDGEIPLGPRATEVATFDLEDLPTGVFRRPTASAPPVEPSAAPAAVVTGHTMRVVLEPPEPET